MMRSRFGKCVSVLGICATMFFVSCEEHQVGEMPEVQREHTDLVTGAQETPAVAPSTVPENKPTPGKSFQENSR